MPTDLAATLRAFHTARASWRPAEAAPPALHAVLPGRYVATPAGECFLVEHQYPLAHRHGALALERGVALTHVTRQVLAHAAGGAFDPAHAVFLDTETTGLAGGTGTYAFLVGLGFLDGDRFVVQQLFMRHPRDEPALLQALSAILGRFPAWITFNGKAFDGPLLATRFRCVSRTPLPAPTHHLDLLPLARRLWRSRLRSCALGALERALLGVSRATDIPSWQIPEAYFAYVRRGEVARLPAIFAHNAADILSMAALLGYLDDVFREPQRYAGRLDPVGGVRLLQRAGLQRDAAAWGRGVLAALPIDEQRQLRWELAVLCQRLGALAEAAAHWRCLAQSGGPWAILALEALAKHYERHEHDYVAARRAAETALTALALYPNPSGPAVRERLERRLGRLWFRSRLTGGGPK